VRTRAPASEFSAFCKVVGAWLGDAAYLDPSLAAVADLIERTDVMAADQVADMASDATDMHAALGASGLISLWGAITR
jgi:hypothetical protein